MKKLIVFFIITQLVGCSSLRSVGNNESYVQIPASNGEIGSTCVNGRCYKQIVIGLKNDGKLTYKDKDYEISVDNKGESFFRDLLKLILGVKLTEEN